MTTKYRCPWCERDELYRNYHDTEWGRPIKDDPTLFEYLILEGFQAGLSWYTVLSKRAHFRHVFDSFDIDKILTYDNTKLESLLQDPGIIRNRLKVHATVTNAQAFRAVQEEWGSFAHYLWSFVDYQVIDNQPQTLRDVPAHTLLSDQISKDLKRRGFKFVGTTVIYAFLQAVGVVNDHLQECWVRHEQK